MLLTDNQPWNISLLDITLQLPWSSTHILANRGAIGNSAMASPYSVICFVRLSMPPRYSSNYIHQPMSMSRLEMISYSLPFLLYTSSLLVVVSGMESWLLDQCSWTSYWAQHLHDGDNNLVYISVGVGFVVYARKSKSWLIAWLINCSTALQC